MPRLVSGRISIHPFVCSALRCPSADEGWESPRLFGELLARGWETVTSRVRPDLLESFALSIGEILHVGSGLLTLSVRYGKVRSAYWLFDGYLTVTGFIQHRDYSG